MVSHVIKKLASMWRHLLNQNDEQSFQLTRLSNINLFAINYDFSIQIRFLVVDIEKKTSWQEVFFHSIQLCIEVSWCISDDVALLVGFSIRFFWQPHFPRKIYWSIVCQLFHFRKPITFFFIKTAKFFELDDEAIDWTHHHTSWTEWLNGAKLLFITCCQQTWNRMNHHGMIQVIIQMDWTTQLPKTHRKYE